MSISYRTRITA